MRVAVVMTVKNEARLLSQNVLYHLGIGVTKIFVYFDGTNDNGAQTLLDFEDVEINDSVKAETYQNLLYLEKFCSNALEHHTARQCLNTYDAIQKCKTQHIDWLISLDADELFLTSKDQLHTLEQFFEIANKQDADIVNLKPMEVVSRKMVYQNVIKEETLFKTKKNFKSKFDQIYQKIYNPYERNHTIVSYWLGHTMGKAAIRVTDNVIPYNVHRYSSLGGRSLKTISMGYLLHYHMYDFEDFIKKFKNFKEHPDTFLSGNKIEDLKSLWIQLVNDPSYSKKDLETYFEKNILFTPNKLKRLYKTRSWNILKRREEAVATIRLPQDVLTKMIG
jgi:hypothetical protein